MEYINDINELKTNITKTIVHYFITYYRIKRTNNIDFNIELPLLPIKEERELSEINLITNKIANNNIVRRRENYANWIRRKHRAIHEVIRDEDKNNHFYMLLASQFAEFILYTNYKTKYDQKRALQIEERSKRRLTPSGMMSGLRKKFSTITGSIREPSSVMNEFNSTELKYILYKKLLIYFYDEVSIYFTNQYLHSIYIKYEKSLKPTLQRIPTLFDLNMGKIITNICRIFNYRSNIKYNETLMIEYVKKNITHLTNITNEREKDEAINRLLSKIYEIFYLICTVNGFRKNEMKHALRSYMILNYGQIYMGFTNLSEVLNNSRSERRNESVRNENVRNENVRNENVRNENILARINLMSRELNSIENKKRLLNQFSEKLYSDCLLNNKDYIKKIHKLENDNNRIVNNPQNPFIINSNQTNQRKMNGTPISGLTTRYRGRIHRIFNNVNM